MVVKLIITGSQFLYKMFLIFNFELHSGFKFPFSLIVERFTLTIMMSGEADSISKLNILLAFFRKISFFVFTWIRKLPLEPLACKYYIYFILIRFALKIKVAAHFYQYLFIKLILCVLIRLHPLVSLHMSLGTSELPSWQDVPFRIKEQPSLRSLANTESTAAVVQIPKPEAVKLPLDLSLSVHYSHIVALVDFHAHLLNIPNARRPKTYAASV